MTTLREQKIVIDGRPINFVVYGTGDKNVLCLPGTLGTWQTDFEPVLHKFDPAIFSVVVWDPPGYGKSRPPRRQYNAQVCRNDAQIVLLLMRIPFAVMGWSEGGRTAFHVADLGQEDVICGVEWGGLDRIYPYGYRFFTAMGDISLWPTERREEYEKIYGAAELATIWKEQCQFYTNTYERVPGGKLLCHNILPCLRQPFLIINGMKDRGMAEPSKYIADTIPNASLLIHPEAGHNIHLQCTDWFFTAVFNFFDHAWE